jgi:fatty acid desaturase
LALAVIAVGVYGYRITGGCLLGLYWQQLAFIGHDSGHNAVTHDKQTDYWIGLIHGPLLSGISISWWKDSHNVHHVSTNSIGHDPDIQHLPFLVCCTRNSLIVDTIGIVFIITEQYAYA